MLQAPPPPSSQAILAPQAEAAALASAQWQGEMAVWQYLREAALHEARRKGTFDEHQLSRLMRLASGYAAKLSDDAAYRRLSELFRTLPDELDVAMEEHQRVRFEQQNEQAATRALQLNIGAAGENPRR